MQPHLEVKGQGHFDQKIVIINLGNKINMLSSKGKIASFYCLWLYVTVTLRSHRVRGHRKANFNLDLTLILKRKYNILSKPSNFI